MHEPLLAQAALPAPRVVLGMLLRPYSLGHDVWLVREGSQLHPDSTRQATLPDLFRAVLICCQTWEESKAMPFDWFAGLKLWLWRKRLGRKIDFLAELASFREYQTFGSLEFPLSDVAQPSRGPAPRAPGSPFVLRLHQWLMQHHRLTESEAWDYPLGLAKMRWACFWESEQGLDVYNAHDAEFDAFVAEQEAKGKESLCQAS